MTTVLFLNIGSGFLLALVALPLLSEKVPPNRFYGIRLRATLADRALWYQANRFAARRLIWSGMALAASALISYWIPGLSVTGYSLLCAAVILIALTVTLLQTLRFVKSRTP
jgi:uncharacterized membrane protein